MTISKRRGDLLLGLAMTAAFSPGLYDLVRQWTLSPWSRYSALFVVLGAWLLRVGPPPSATQRGVGLAAVGAGLVLQLTAGLAVMPALTRPALVLGALGFLWLRGLAPLAIAWVAVWVVPVPHQLADGLGGDAVAAALFRTAAVAVNALGVGVAAGARRVVSGDATLVVDSSQSGLPVLAAMLGLVAYAALRLGTPALRALVWVPAAGAAALAAQLAASALACLALASSAPALAGFCVDSVAWMLPAALVVWRVEQRARSAPAAS